MPNPLSEQGQHAIRPNNFDPNLHCGAYTPRNNSVCMNMAGASTDHLGEGRCKDHGGATPIKDGRRSLIKKYNGKTSLEKRVEEIRNSEDLLSMDNEIAWTKAVSEDMLHRFAQRMEVWGRIMDAAAAGEFDDVEGPPSFDDFMSEFPHDLIKLANTMVTTSFNMKFSKRFSIPITELENIVRQVVREFGVVCTMFSLPDAARIEFADRMSRLQVSRPMDDKALMYAGADRPIRDNIIDVGGN